MVPERTEFLQLVLPHAPARRGQLIEEGLIGQPTVQSDQLPCLIAHGVAMGRFDGGQFDREKYPPLIVEQEPAKGRNILHRPKAQQGGHRAERDEAIRRAELLGEGMPIPQPFGWIAQGGL